jgi:hypothetical protein
VRVLVTGFGRSGTQWTAKVLARLGVRCHHERVYQHDLDPKESAPGLVAERWGNSDAECSWLAVPFLRTLPEDVIVWHQLRDPLLALRCWCHTKLLTSHEAACRFVQAVFPETAVGDVVDRSVQYLTRWTTMAHDFGRVSRNYIRYRLEALTPEHLGVLLDVAGHHRDVERVREVMRDVPPSTGSCGHSPDERPRWSDYAVRGADRLRAMAEAYGYQYE